MVISSADATAEARRDLGRSIRDERRKRTATLAEIAAAAGISVSLLSQVERGRADPSLNSLRAVARAGNDAPPISCATRRIARQSSAASPAGRSSSSIVRAGGRS